MPLHVDSCGRGARHTLRGSSHAELDAETASGGVYLQLGAFNSQRGAEEFLSSMRAKLGNTGKQLGLSHKNGMVKVRIGPYSSADTARATALQLQERLGFKPVLSLY